MSLVTLETQAPQLGRVLQYPDVVRGLQELQRDLEFDHATKHGDRGPRAETQVGVNFLGLHLCSMDRGAIPEFMLWDGDFGEEPIRMCDIEKYEDSKVCYMEVLKTDAAYHHALTMAQRGDDEFQFGEDGKVFCVKAFRFTTVKNRIIRAGWRRTFRVLAASGVPGITVHSINGKFGVDLLKYSSQGLPDPEFLCVAGL